MSLDEIARAVGVRKQTVLYWFASKDDLVDEVLAVAATELVVVIDAALRAAPDDPLDRIDAVVRAVFRPAVRRPALLGLIREVSRLDSDQATRLRERLQRARRPCGRLPGRRDGRRPAPAWRSSPRRGARLRDGHRHRHRTRGAPSRRLVGRRDGPAPPPRRAPSVPPRRPRPVIDVTPGAVGSTPGVTRISAWCCGGGGRGVRGPARRARRSARCRRGRVASTASGTSRSG